MSESFSKKLSPDQIKQIFSALSIEVTAKVDSSGWVTIRSPLRDDDHNPSFGLNLTTTAYKDHATGESGDIVTLVQKLRGVDAQQAISFIKDVAGIRDEKQIVATYDYTDEAGKLLYQVVRYDPKTFRPRRPDGKRGWIWNMKGVRRVLYHLPAVLEVKITGRIIFIVEGEKDVHTLEKHGLHATCNAGGAEKWLKEYTETLAGASVVILPDNDQPGRKHGALVARQLHDAGCNVRVVELPGLPEKGDVSDFLKTHPADELKKLVKDTPVYVPDESEPDQPEDGALHRQVSSIESESVSWLWPGRIPFGKNSMIAGDPGLGKSFVTLDLAARFTRGRPWPDGTENGRGSVILLSAEDDPADTIRPRLDAAGADVSRIYLLDAVRKIDKEGVSQERFFSLSDDIEALGKMIVETGARLIIIDPITAYLSGVDSHKNAELRSVLAPLAKLAADYRAAIICVSHLNKGGTSAQYRVMGSLAFTAAARAVFVVAKDKDDESRRLIVPLKNNLAEDKKGLAYKLIPSEMNSDIAVVAWEKEPVQVSLQEALESHPGPEATERKEAERWLSQLLEHGKMAASEIKKQAINDGFSMATVHRAKDRLGVKAEREGGIGAAGRWMWSLRFQPEPEPTPLEPEILGGTWNLRQNEPETPLFETPNIPNTPDSTKISGYREGDTLADEKKNGDGYSAASSQSLAEYYQNKKN